jgi:post-segregation antitoxin (ccd killing protein)
MDNMKVTLEVPESLAERLRGPGENLSRAALEALAVEAYRLRRISSFELCEWLEIESPVEMERFLKAHGVQLEYTIDDFEAESATSSRLREKRQADLNHFADGRSSE